MLAIGRRYEKRLNWLHCNNQQLRVIRELCTLKDASGHLDIAYEEHLDDLSESVRLIQSCQPNIASHDNILLVD